MLNHPAAKKSNLFNISNKYNHVIQHILYFLNVASLFL